MKPNCQGVALEDHDVIMCVGCPVKDPCQAIYDDYMSAVDARGLDMTGVWGGHLYESIPQVGYFVDGAKRPPRKGGRWA